MTAVPHQTPARSGPAATAPPAGTPEGQPLTAARRHRAELLSVIQGFERAIAAPTADPAWRDRVRERLSALRAAFAGHERVTEGPNGLYAELLDTSPRLARAVGVLTREHSALHTALDLMVQRVDDTDPERLRRWASDLLRELSRHRQRGADLVYEAYATDIGGET